MTKTVSIIVGILCSIAISGTSAQAPKAFKYQALVKDNGGQPLSQHKINFLTSIWSESDRIFSEMHLVETDAAGLVHLNIGEGTPVYSTFDQIDWSDHGYILRIEMDEMAGTNFKLLGESQLLSVPYSLYADNAGNALFAEKAGNTDDADADPLNEIQTLIIEGHVISLSLTDQEPIDLSLYLDNTDAQTLTIKGNQLSISGGNTIELPVASPGSDPVIPDPKLPVPMIYRGYNLYAHPTDNSSGIIFGEFLDAGANSNADGESNTEAIVKVNSANDATLNFAAKTCFDLEAFGFDDWYLPSRFELDALYKQSYLIQGYEANLYWTSTETTANKALVYHLGTGNVSESTKNKTARCRCVRKD